MFSKILVPLDGSPTAEKALPYARLFARGLKLPAELLTVFDITEIPSRLSAEDFNGQWVTIRLRLTLRPRQETIAFSPGVSTPKGIRDEDFEPPNRRSRSP
jgi:nucleotide-binding universal stress UspA family protein